MSSGPDQSASGVSVKADPRMPKPADALEVDCPAGHGLGPEVPPEWSVISRSSAFTSPVSVTEKESVPSLPLVFFALTARLPETSLSSILTESSVLEQVLLNGWNETCVLPKTLPGLEVLFEM